MSQSGARAELPDWDDLDAIKGALTDRLEELAEQLLGAPNKGTRRRSEWRWGKKGSAALIMRGPKRGAFYTHEGQEGGSPLDLIVHARNCTLRSAIEWARDWLGVSGDDTSVRRAAEGDVERQRRERERAEKQARASAEQAADEARRIGIARAIWAEGEPLTGTPGERYLVETRAIPKPTSWPDCIAWHPGRRAVLFAAHATDDTLQAVQLVHVTADGRKVGEEEIAARVLPAVKVTRGVLDGAAVRLPGWAIGPLQAAEGPETGLSCWAATGYETWIALGATGSLPLPTGRRVVVCRDDDRRFSPADKTLAKAIAAWRRQGIDLAVATPWPARRGDKSDFNDTIRADGSAAVRDRIAAALGGATRPVHRLPVEQARAEVQRAADGFFGQVDAISVARVSDPPPCAAAEPTDWIGLTADEKWAAAFTPLPESSKLAPRLFTHAVRVDVGVGKSHAARQGAAATLARMRTRGDQRTGVVAVPTHKLGDEQATLFEALETARKAGLCAAVWRGRAAPDPTYPGQTMCQDLERVRDAQDAGLDVQTAACRRKIQGQDGKEWAECPFFRSCAYQAQRRRKADLWIVPHEMLFAEKPAAVGEVAFVVVDEAAWQDGLEGETGHPPRLSLDALAAADQVPGHPLNTDRLLYLRGLALEGLRGLTDGPVPRDAMVAVDLSSEASAEARRMEWQRKSTPPMHPRMTREQRKEAVKAAEGNRTIMRLAWFWRAMEALLADGGPAASGWAEIATITTKDGPQRVVQLKDRRPVRDGWQAPTLLLDALLPIDLVRHYWPDVEIVAEVLAEAPHQRVRQVVDRAYSKAMLEPLDNEAAERNPEEARRRLRNLRELRAILVREARQHAPGRVLAVVQKGIREALEKIGPLPPNLEMAHHNAVAGRDEWRDVAGLIVVGRTMPSPAAVERMAEALTGVAVTPLEGWYERTTVTRETAQGSTTGEADRHPDPIAEAIRWQVAEGELVQIIGRARGVNRTAADPVNVLVLTDTPIPLPVAEMLTAADLELPIADLMLGMGGIAFENATDAAAAYDTLWATRDAARQAFLRERRLATFPYKDSPIGKCRQPLLRAEYLRRGAGKSPAAAWIVPGMVVDATALLAERLGPLAWCRIDGELVLVPELHEHPGSGKPAQASPEPPSAAVGPIVLSETTHAPPAFAQATCEPSPLVPTPGITAVASQSPLSEPELAMSDDPKGLVAPVVPDCAAPALDPAMVFPGQVVELPPNGIWSIGGRRVVSVRCGPNTTAQQVLRAAMLPGAAGTDWETAPMMALLPEPAPDSQAGLWMSWPPMPVVPPS